MGLFMSIARFGTRASVVGLSVLASLAFTAAPSWAGGGNSANAALCEEGGYPGALLAQDGSAFKNAGQCTSYGAQGGQIAGLNIVAGPVSVPIGEFIATYSGFGLKPNSPVFIGERFPSGVLVGYVLPEVVGSNGEFSESRAANCGIVALVVGATTAAGSEVLREFPPSSGC
jgi:hypothetical protein